ncbi:MAG: hypothetical protein IH919_10545 [Deltaproteobacteria bacterium]|nr:hypothetical protein [Deltaproteobacteria bacterium]
MKTVNWAGHCISLLTGVALGIVALPFSANVAFAQADAGADADEQVEEIIVTGSRIRRAGFDTLQPAVQIDADFLETRGFINIAEAINEEIAQQARELIAKQDHSLSKVELEQLVEAVLIRNSLDGEGDKKGSSYAAKLLGSLSRVNLFEPETSVNPIFMTVPAEWRDRYYLSDEKPPEIDNPAPPALPPAPEPTGEPQQET